MHTLTILMKPLLAAAWSGVFSCSSNSSSSSGPFGWSNKSCNTQWLEYNNRNYSKFTEIIECCQVSTAIWISKQGFSSVNITLALIHHFVSFKHWWVPEIPKFIFQLNCLENSSNTTAKRFYFIWHVGERFWWPIAKPKHVKKEKCYEENYSI